MPRSPAGASEDRASISSSETDQAEIYERLKGEGLTVKVVTT